MDDFKDKLEEIYKEEHYRLYMKAVDALGDFFLAEDVVEEVFVTIIMHYRWWNGLSKKDRVKYAEKTCALLCEEILRTREKRRQLPYKDDVPEKDYCEAKEQVNFLEREMLLKYIGKLSKEDQEIFAQKYFDGLSIKSIAQIHNISEAKVSQRLSRGRKYLKRVIK